MTDIVQKGDPVLREHAQEVPLNTILKPEIQTILSRMSEALATQKDGVAIAAPQIGEPLRIFVVSHKVFQEYDEKDKPVPPLLTEQDDRVFINPEIINISKKTDHLEEGCLSVRYWYGTVERARQATVRAYNKHGKEFTLGSSGLLAQIFQHEIDHLNGILFVDKAEDLHEVDPKTLN